MTLAHAALRDAASEVAHEAGELVMGYYARRDVAVHSKGGDPRDLVTDADLAADAAIRAGLMGRFPDHDILTEESYHPGQVIDDDRPTWVVDPIDGTSNFSARLPLFAISIGLRYRGRSEVGVIHAPALGWTFSAVIGEGAWLDGRPIGVVEEDDLSRAIVAADWSRNPPRRRRVLEAYTDFGQRVHTLRALGSAALGLAAVAAGWCAIYYNYQLSPWDTAAGALLVEEAGGQVSHIDGSDWRIERGDILVSNGPLHAAAVEILRQYFPD